MNKIILKYNQYGSMSDFCRTINRNIFARKKDAIQYNYLM